MKKEDNILLPSRSELVGFQKENDVTLLNSIFTNIESDLLEEDETLFDTPDYNLVEIEATINDFNVKPLIDSGAQISAIDKIFLSQIEQQQHVKFPRILIENINIVAATGNKSKRVNKQTIVELKIFNLQVSVNLVIVPDLNVNLILGCDFMKQNSVILDFPEKLITITNVKIPFYVSKVNKSLVCQLIISDCNNEETVWAKSIQFLNEKLEGQASDAEISEINSIFNEYRKVLKRLKTVAEQRYNKSKNKVSKIVYKEGELVLIKNILLSNKVKKVSRKFAPRYKGPYKIMKCYEKNYFKIAHCITGNEFCVNRQMIKKYYS